jgi:hypothetical protein
MFANKNPTNFRHADFRFNRAPTEDMAYDEYLTDRIRKAFRDQHAFFEEKKMMGGICFLVDGKMC